MNERIFERETMLEIIIGLAILTFMFWLSFHITGALLSAAIWLFIKLPLFVLIGSLGLILCVTIILIPVGIKCFKLAWNILF